MSLVPLPSAHESLGKLLSSSCKRLPDRPSLHLLSFWFVHVSLSLPPSCFLFFQPLSASFSLVVSRVALSFFLSPARAPPNLTSPAPPPSPPPRRYRRVIYSYAGGMGILSLRLKVIRRSARRINRACHYICSLKIIFE